MGKDEARLFGQRSDYLQVDRAVPTGVFHRCAGNEKSVRALQQISVAMPDDRVAGLLWLLESN